jgi:hypothetical protein
MRAEAAGMGAERRAKELERRIKARERVADARRRAYEAALREAGAEEGILFGGRTKEIKPEATSG